VCLLFAVSSGILDLDAGPRSGVSESNSEASLTSETISNISIPCHQEAQLPSHSNRTLRASSRPQPPRADR
jgi:hypothetical protein